MMDVDSDNDAATSNVDDWLARFSPVAASKPGAFPFTSHKIQSIEFRRARMSDLLIFDVLLIRGGIRDPDMLFPPTDWVALSKLLGAIDESVYDLLKKDCLVYILLKWAWSMDPKEANPGWDIRYLQDRCIAPQFAALADAYWLLDTGTHLAKAVSILSDARLNRDYVSKILQALALSSSSTSFTSGAASPTAALIVQYVRTAKPLLTEPDDIDLYTLALAQLSFMDAWAYQKSFPERSDTRERLLRKIVGWCLMPTLKRDPLAQLLALPLSSYEQSFLHTLALPSQFSTSPSLSNVNTAVPSSLVLSSQAISILQDLLCVRAIQSGDYVRAIKLDRQFSSVSSPGSGPSSSSVASQTVPSGRDTIDRRSIIQDLFATLPPAERTLLEDEIGQVATGVRAGMSLPLTPRQGASAMKRPPVAELGLSASWEDVGAATGSPAPSTSVSVSSAVGTGFAGKATSVPVSTISKMNPSPFSASTSTSPFASHVPRFQPAPGHQVPPTPKFTAFGSPISRTTGASMGRGVITERSKTLFSTNTTGGPSTALKPATHVSLFDTTGSAKTAPNAFYKPLSSPAARALLDVGGALASSSTNERTGRGTNTAKQNGKAQGGETNEEDASMGSRSDVEIIEENHHDESGGEEAATDEDEVNAGSFITYDKSGAIDLTLHAHHADEAMDEDHGVGPGLGFSVFSGSGHVVQDDSACGHEKGTSGSRHTPQVSSPPCARVSPSREGDKTLRMSVNSATSRSRAPPGAFHHEEEEEEEDRHVQREHEVPYQDEDKDDRASRTTPISSSRRSTRTGVLAPTLPPPSTRSQPQRSSKNTSRPSTRIGGTSSGRQSLNQTIPGSLMDEDNDEHGQDDADHTDAHGGEDTEVDEQGEEDDAFLPLPSRPSRRTRSAGYVGTSTATFTKSKPSAKTSAAGRASAAATTAKGKAKARPSEVQTPARRSSRLSTASSLSPDHTEVASPTKKGRKSTGAKGSVTGSGSGTVAMRSSSRRKR